VIYFFSGGAGGRGGGVSSPELFGRPSPSPRTSLKSADSDFENTSDLDSDSACLFVYAFIL
jgi:hypothetical protein